MCNCASSLVAVIFAFWLDMYYPGSPHPLSPPCTPQCSSSLEVIIIIIVIIRNLLLAPWSSRAPTTHVHIIVIHVAVIIVDVQVGVAQILILQIQ